MINNNQKHTATCFVLPCRHLFFFFMRLFFIYMLSLFCAYPAFLGFGYFKYSIWNNSIHHLENACLFCIFTYSILSNNFFLSYLDALLLLPICCTSTYPMLYFFQANAVRLSPYTSFYFCLGV